jgi:hypothetical protein
MRKLISRLMVISMVLPTLNARAASNDPAGGKGPDSSAKGTIEIELDLGTYEADYKNIAESMSEEAKQKVLGTLKSKLVPLSLDLQNKIDRNENERLIVLGGAAAGFISFAIAIVKTRKFDPSTIITEGDRLRYLSNNSVRNLTILGLVLDTAAMATEVHRQTFTKPELVRAKKLVDGLISLIDVTEKVNLEVTNMQ